ncbi:XylR N-terminal domain-containing protein [Bacillus sp. AGMB 02131]|uniref:XylR N-terminal domain-containing protein n=2 Tax=Peribacillus faecalis TaxID=2772559 RepID=A0A927HA71_9BACI|nr:XylR N-terminal domain-containing protein [Peribacillus faecalis]
MALISAEALGFLRRDLVTTLNMERAKGFLLRYGWVSGHNDGESLVKMYEWTSKKELILAGTSMHTLEGVVTVEPDILEVNEDELYMTGYWRHSFEAQEHIRHFGYSDEGVCWMLIGYATGFLAATFGKEVVIYEQCCAGKKDDYCYFVARTVEHCEPKHHDILRYYKQESLTSEFDRIYSEVKMLNTVMNKSEQVNQQLTDLLLEGKNILHLMNALTTMVGKSIVIERGGVYKSIEACYVNKDDEAFYHHWSKQSQRKFDERIRSFSIKTKEKVLGRLILISDEPLSMEQEKVIERSLSIFSIQMHTERTIAQSLWGKKIDFFNELLEERADIAALLSKAQHIFEIDVNKSNRVIVLHCCPPEQIETIQLLLQTAFQSHDIFIKKGYVVIIMEEQPCLETHMLKIETFILQHFNGLKVYMGAGRLSTSIEGIGESYCDAFRICDFLRCAYPTKSKFTTYEQLDPVMLVLRSTEPKPLIAFYQKILGKLVTYDEENEASLIQTLRTYLENNGNVNCTAKELNLSIPGFRYRLEKIESLLDSDLRTGSGRFQCQMAMQVHLAMLSTSQKNGK